MQMPVLVGIIVSIIFLVSFSGWFYHLAEGWGEIVIDDVYFRYRMLGASLLSFVVIVSTFFGMAIVTECPNKEREGVFENLRCEEYLQLKAGTDKIFGVKPMILEDEIEEL